MSERNSERGKGRDEYVRKIKGKRDRRWIKQRREYVKGKI